MPHMTCRPQVDQARLPMPHSHPNSTSPGSLQSIRLLADEYSPSWHLPALLHPFYEAVIHLRASIFVAPGAVLVEQL